MKNIVYLLILFSTSLLSQEGGIVKERVQDSVFYVIGESFTKHNNAKKVLSKWMEYGYSAEIINGNNKNYQVAIQHFSNYKSAREFANRMTESDRINYWVLKKVFL